MKIEIDTEKNTIILNDNGNTSELDLYTTSSFEILSDLWVKVGWNQKYPYTFSWFGRPVIQLPEDMIRMQEVIYRLKPDLIIETGVAHGGSLIYYASLFEAMGKGKVIGVDIEIRDHNRKAIEAHELFHRIDMIEGSSIDPETVAKVKEMIPANATVLVILDSNHLREHVKSELELYSPFVTKGSYIVSTDGVMRDVADVPRGEESWSHDNPAQAAEEFVAGHSDFEIEQPEWPFNESNLNKNITHWPSAWVRKI